MTSQKKKKPVLAIKNRIFQNLNNHTFSKGITDTFGQKMPIFWLFRFGQNIVSAFFKIQVLLSKDFRLYDEEIILCTPSKTSS